jgi:protein-S-isoprenylcysteine O-methyltransferase Ste14
MKITKSLIIAFFIFPFNVMGTIPVAMVWFDGEVFLFSWFSLTLGGILIGLGVIVIYKTVASFTSHGNGTPAPYDPPKNFVVNGLYGHVRNPMMIGVFSVLIGEAVFFRSYLILGWGLFFMVANLIYVPLFEESELSIRFGDSYLEYTKKVPRWLPMKNPWNP